MRPFCLTSGGGGAATKQAALRRKVQGQGQAIITGPLAMALAGPATQCIDFAKIGATFTATRPIHAKNDQPGHARRMSRHVPVHPPVQSRDMAGKLTTAIPCLQTADASCAPPPAPSKYQR